MAGVACAVCPLPVTRYALYTLSLWSWSMSAKSRVVWHAWPSCAVPARGTRRMCLAISWLARV